LECIIFSALRIGLEWVFTAFSLEYSLIQEAPSGPNSEQSLAPLADEPRPHPLFKAAVVSDSEQLVQMHIARGRELDARDDSGTTLLGLAASKGRLGTLKLLLEAGADPTIRDSKGRDPLGLARTNGFYEVAELLAACCAPPVSESEVPTGTLSLLQLPVGPYDLKADRTATGRRTVTMPA
jgi:hypothetical protein